LPDRIVEFIGLVADGFNARDVETLIELCDPNVDFDTPLANYRGHEGLRKWRREFDEAWGDEISTEPEAYLERGKRTIVSYVLRGRGRHSEVEVAMQNAVIGTWREGLIVDLKVYADLQDALSAMGVSADELVPIEPRSREGSI
jgi:ketosteroid isomerase-like protein